MFHETSQKPKSSDQFKRGKPPGNANSEKKLPYYTRENPEPQRIYDDKRAITSQSQHRKGDNFRKNPTLLKNPKSFHHGMPKSALATIEIFDKERLKEENSKMRNELNMMKEKLRKQRITIAAADKEKSKYEKMFAELDSFGKIKNSSKGFTGQESLVLNLKRQLKESNKENVKLKSEVELLKKSSKQTELNEKEVENQNLLEETARLRSMLEGALNYQQMESKGMDEEAITILKRQNLELDCLIQNCNKEKLSSSNRIKEVFEKENLMLKKQALEKEKQIKYLQAENRNPTRNTIKEFNAHESRGGYSEDKLASDLELKLKQINSLQNALKLKEVKINELERKIKDMEIEQQEKILNEKKEKNAIISKLDKALAELHEFKKNQDIRNISDVHDESLNISKSELMRSQAKRGSLQEKDVIKVKTVMHEEIGKISKELRFNLMNERIDIERAMNALFTRENITEGVASVAEIETALSKSPFNIQSSEDRTLMARYLVEDNSEPFIDLDKSIENNVNVIKSVFKKSLNDFVLPLEREVALMHNKIFSIMGKYKNGIEQAVLTTSNKVKKEHYSMEEIIEAFNFLEVVFSPEELEYIESELYKNSKSLDNYRVNDLVELLFEMEVPNENQMQNLSNYQNEQSFHSEGEEDRLRQQRTSGTDETLQESRNLE